MPPEGSIAMSHFHVFFFLRMNWKSFLRAWYTLIPALTIDKNVWESVWKRYIIYSSKYLWIGTEFSINTHRRSSSIQFFMGFFGLYNIYQVLERKLTTSSWNALVSMERLIQSMNISQSMVFFLKYVFFDAFIFKRFPRHQKYVLSKFKLRQNRSFIISMGWRYYFEKLSASGCRTVLETRILTGRSSPPRQIFFLWYK